MRRFPLQALSAAAGFTFLVLGGTMATASCAPDGFRQYQAAANGSWRLMCTEWEEGTRLCSVRSTSNPSVSIYYYAENDSDDRFVGVRPTSSDLWPYARIEVDLREWQADEARNDEFRSEELLQALLTATTAIVSWNNAAGRREQAVVTLEGLADTIAAMDAVLPTPTCQ